MVAAQPKTQLAPKVVTNARTEGAPKKNRVARKYPRDDDPRNPVWWLLGLSEPDLWGVREMRAGRSISKTKN
jgi:hypothetical protein